MSKMGGWQGESKDDSKDVKKEGDGRKEWKNKNEVQVGRMRRRRTGVTNLAAILERDIFARLRLLINKQYCCEIGLMTK